MFGAVLSFAHVIFKKKNLKKVDVVPLGTNRLLNLIDRFIACKGGGILRELYQGQNMAYL